MLVAVEERAARAPVLCLRALARGQIGRFERASGGTTKITISAAKASEAMAPSRINSQSLLRRAATVTTAAPTPLSTTRVPSTVLPHLLSTPIL